jgi:hypothetical protein
VPDIGLFMALACRYADQEWLRQTRRWPPRLCEALGAFLEIRAVRKAAPAATT